MPADSGFIHLKSAQLPTRAGDFIVHAFVHSENQQEILVLRKGAIQSDKPVLTRIHSSCLTGDVLGSKRCDCGVQLKMAMELIAQSEQGLLFYLPQEGRGIGLANKIKAYAAQDQGLDTVDANKQLGFAADLRRYDDCATIFNYFKVRQVLLLTNNPQKIAALKLMNFDSVERVPLQAPVTEANRSYLATKSKRLGHLLD